MLEAGVKTIGWERVRLTDLIEKLTAAGLCFSDLLPGQALRIRVAGWSMSPALQTGDHITVESVSTAQLRIGDLVLFHDRGRLICHRLLAMEETEAGPRLITKGDAATGSGEVIQADQVLGRVVAVTPRWSYAGTSGWVGALAMRIDLARERLIHLIAQGLQYLQGLRGYRWIMRNVLSHSFAFYHGVPERSQWIKYQSSSRDGDTPLPTNHRDFHLLAKLGETSVGSLEGKAVTEGYRIDNLYVRIRYRGMGVGSQILALAATAAAVRGARVLLASVEPANTVALHLFTKMGFCKTGASQVNEVSLRQDL